MGPELPVRNTEAVRLSENKNHCVVRHLRRGASGEAGEVGRATFS